MNAKTRQEQADAIAETIRVWQQLIASKQQSIAERRTWIEVKKKGIEVPETHKVTYKSAATNLFPGLPVDLQFSADDAVRIRMMEERAGEIDQEIASYVGRDDVEAIEQVANLDDELTKLSREFVSILCLYRDRLRDNRPQSVVFDTDCFRQLQRDLAVAINENKGYVSFRDFAITAQWDHGDIEKNAKNLICNINKTCERQTLPYRVRRHKNGFQAVKKV